MKTTKLLLVSTLLLSFCIGAQAQTIRPDVELMNLKGHVKTLGTFTRGSHGRMIGQPTMQRFHTNGFLDQLFVCDTMGKATLMVQYTYDKKNHLVKDTRSQMGTNELIAVTEYTYNKKDRTVTADVMVITDSINDHMVTTYDKSGKIIRTALYDEQDTLLSAQAYVYDHHGKVSTITHTGSHDRYQNHVNYRYDADGNEIMKESCYLNRTTQLLFHIYTFDETGNWIERRTYRIQGETATLQESASRTIEYYEED